MIRDYITMTMLTMMMLMKKAQKATATLIQKRTAILVGKVTETSKKV